MKTELVSVIFLLSGSGGSGFSQVRQQYLAPAAVPSLAIRNVLFPLASSPSGDQTDAVVNDSEIQSSEEDISTETKRIDGASQPDESSKRQMLNFALPALGIFLANPLLSNIDNAFVGQTVGTQGLAALSPATICTDQMLYLFSFLPRAATGLVARAYGGDKKKNVDGARQAASAPLTVALFCGVCLSIFYATCTPALLNIFRVDSSLKGAAASYIYWRGAIAWAALGQSVALSILLATRDAWTPLLIVALAAGINVLGDAAFCVWPLRAGCAGAAAATAGATLVSSAFLGRALYRKGLFPSLRRLPTKQDAKALMEFTGPLLAITITRLVGFVSMQRCAMRLGVQSLAGYQLCINLVLFFLLFGEPLSQLSQTKLPALLDDTSEEGGTTVRATLRNVLSLGAGTALVVGACAAGTLLLGAPWFTADAAVQQLARAAVPSVFVTVATAIFAVAVDGAMLASRDFGFMLTQGLTTCALQLWLLRNWATSIPDIFATFTIRLGSYAVVSLVRSYLLGRGTLGRVLAQGRPRVQVKPAENPGIAS